MAGDVDVLVAVRYHRRVPARDVVHHPANRLFVPGDLTRREHDDVLGLELHVAMVVDRNPRQRRLRLALRAGADADHVLTREVAHFAVPDLHAGRDPEVAQALGDLRVLDNPAPDERYSPIELRGQIGQDLDPIEARRKHRDHDLPGRAREDLLESVDDIHFRTGEASPVDIRAIGQEREYAGRSQLREAVDVDVLAIERRLVNLEVTGMNHYAA